MFLKIFKKKLLTRSDEKLVVETIRQTELKTTGEIHVHISCQKLGKDGVISDASVMFQKLNLHKTKDRNGVLIYINSKAQEFALLGDQGIHQLMTTTGWERAASEMSRKFKDNQFAPAIVTAIQELGALLTERFPVLDAKDNPNELSDEISKS